MARERSGRQLTQHVPGAGCITLSGEDAAHLSNPDAVSVSKPRPSEYLYGRSLSRLRLPDPG